MAKKNEIIEEQRKARKQFLELKKMQKGEIEPDSNQAVELSVREKVTNFWNYHKWHLLAVILAVFIIAFGINQCVNSRKPDMNIVAFTYNASAENQVGILRDYMEGICEDINGDGEVYINVVDCSYDPKNKNGQYEYMVLNKLQSVLTADYDSLIFITDSESYKYFSESETSKGLFNDEPYSLPKEFFEGIAAEETPYELVDLQISCRSFYGTVLESDKNAKAVYEQSVKIIEKIKNEQ